MLQVQNISKSFGEQCLLKDVSFIIGKKERIGLVGRNGSGKSTLFKIILGDEEYDGGNIEIPKRYTLGYLEQHIHFTCENILDEACLDLPEQEGGWKEIWKAEEILGGLGITTEMQSLSPSLLSGGYQIRLNLAKVLLSDPDLLLLDEPTNYLDIVSIRWLEKFLTSWRGELLLITHDRNFMNSVCTHTIGIHRQNIRKIKGSTQKLDELTSMNEELQIRTLENEEAKKAEMEAYINRFRAKASKAKSVQSRVKALDRMDDVEKLDNIANLEFRFNAAPFPGKRLMRVSDLSFGYDKNNILFKDLNFEIFPQDRIGVVGPNGRGKTTLLNVLAHELKELSGEIEESPNMSLGYFGQTNIQRLSLENNIVDEILSASDDVTFARARSLAGLMMFEGDSALKQVNVLSGGERSRVMLARILAQPCNMLFLDEPTNHLDMESIDSMIEAIDVFPGALMVVTHSEQILHAICNRLIVFDNDEAFLFEGNYTDFLNKIGWQGEKKDKPTKGRKIKSTPCAEDKDVSSLNKKEERKLRAAANAEKNKILNPLKKEVIRLEKAIDDAEKELARLENEMLDAASDNDNGRIIEISEKQGLLNKKKNDFYSNYEISFIKLEELTEQYKNS